MRSILPIVGIVCALGIEPSAARTETPVSDIVVRVVDENGQPVPGAYFYGYGYWKRSQQEGLTDTNGMFRYKDQVRSEVGGRITKDKYYKSSGGFWSNSWNGPPLPSTNTVVLKRIVDPVPMAYRDVKAVFPRLDEPVGFDLAAGDWVAPDGKGDTADMLLTATKRFVSWEDFLFSVQITFPGEHDGIHPFVARNPSSPKMASDLMPPQRAPDTGYSRSMTAWVGQKPGERVAYSLTEDRNHVFQTRTRKNEQGEIVAANVGWTDGDIGASPTEDTNGMLFIRYYFNPDPHSRSLEPKSIADQQGKKEP